ncbi:MAG: ubiquinone/menaquinone biosynthesis methyltransferase [candidate division Zixibacteria bacterium]|nr:ubiquinone/menaquinone biosynthesis methyltransferase [candidate division Zixibacteria bacterium]
MNKKYFTDNASKKIFIHRMFDDISIRYDFLNRVISFGSDGYLRKKTIAPHINDKTVLDICSGTGDLSRMLLKQPDFNGVVILGDFSKGMIRLASQKFAANDNVFYVLCDAEDLPFKGSSFDGIINGYALRNLTDIEAFGAEIHRTLMPSGKSSIIDFAHPPGKLFAWLFHLYFYKILPLLSRLFTKKNYAYRYLPDSLKAFLKQDEILKTLKQDRLSGHYENILKGAVAIYRLRK